jgi:hypothetical protein
LGSKTAEKETKMQEIAKELLIDFIRFGPAILFIILILHKEIRRGAIKHRKLVRAVTLIVIATIYLNIGWAYGTYTAMHLGSEMPQTTVLQKFLIGPNEVLTAGPDPSLLVFQIIYMIVWPVSLGVAISAWIIWLLVAVAAWTLWLVMWLLLSLQWVIISALKLVFAGGIAKLLGVG